MSRNGRAAEWLMRVFLIASAVTAIGAAAVAVRRMSATGRSVPDGIPVALLAPPSEPIAAEALVFRTRAIDLAINPTPDQRRAAHPHTLATFRSLRAYPGAPPRIPHGLTPTEFLTGRCKSCHERGGFSERFDAYVPVTPHPDMGACLQCHVGDATLMAIALPNADPNARCLQCHAPGAARWTDSSLDWRPMAWPQLTKNARGRNPPPIPHELQMRDNCLACHSGPAGVAEIQTPHADRPDCRRCHVAAGYPREPLRRPARRSADAIKGTP